MSELYRRMPDLRPRMEAWGSELIGAMGAFADVIYPGVCDARESVGEAMSAILAADAEMLIVFPLTYAPSHLVLPFLRTLPVPVLLLNSQSLGDFGAEATARAFIDNQAPTGLFDLSNALTRSSIPFRVASGHYRDPRLLEDLRDWCRAAQAAAAARRFRVGLAGHAMDGMGDLAVDHTALLDQLGAEVLHVSVAEISSRAESAPAEEVRRLMEEDRSRFAVDAELRPQEHEASSRLEHALRAVAAEHRLDALTFHFEALLADGRIRTIPVLAACKLLAEGIGYAGEGDVTCAALVAMMGRLAGPAEFFETWGIDFAGEAVMKNHMGEGNFLLAREDLPVRLTRSPVGLGEAMAPAATSFVLKPGEATLVNLATGRGGRLKLTVAEGSVPEMRPIAGVQTPHGKFTPGIPVRDFLERYAMAGASHHSALVYGRRAGLVERLAWILGLEMQVI